MNGSDMGLLDDLNNIDGFTKSGGVRCTTCALISTLTETETTMLNKLLQNPEISFASVSRALKANGHTISQGTLSRHAKGECNGAR